jgi:hypothetical protein
LVQRSKDFPPIIYVDHALRLAAIYLDMPPIAKITALIVVLFPVQCLSNAHNEPFKGLIPKFLSVCPLSPLYEGPDDVSYLIDYL